MSSFRKPFSVIRRNPGGYVNGLWTDGAETTSTVQATVQPMSLRDFSESGVAHEGSNLSDYRTMFTTSKLTVQGDGDSPGDLVIVGGEKFLIVGIMDNNTLGTDVSHYQYYLMREIKHEVGKSPI